MGRSLLLTFLALAALSSATAASTSLRQGTSRRKDFRDGFTTGFTTGITNWRELALLEEQGPEDDVAAAKAEAKKSESAKSNEGSPCTTPEVKGSCDCKAVPIMTRFECIERNNVTFTKPQCEKYAGAVWRTEAPGYKDHVSKSASSLLEEQGPENDDAAAKAEAKKSELAKSNEGSPCTTPEVKGSCDCKAVPIMTRFECIERNNVTFTKPQCEKYAGAVWRTEAPGYKDHKAPSK